MSTRGQTPATREVVPGEFTGRTLWRQGPPFPSCVPVTACVPVCLSVCGGIAQEARAHEQAQALCSTPSECIPAGGPAPQGPPLLSVWRSSVLEARVGHLPL